MWARESINGNKMTNPDSTARAGLHAGLASDTRKNLEKFQQRLPRDQLCVCPSFFRIRVLSRYRIETFIKVFKAEHLT